MSREYLTLVGAIDFFNIERFVFRTDSGHHAFVPRDLEVCLLNNMTSLASGNARALVGDRISPTSLLKLIQNVGYHKIDAPSSEGIRQPKSGKGKVVDFTDGETSDLSSEDSDYYDSTADDEAEFSDASSDQGKEVAHLRQRSVNNDLDQCMPAAAQAATYIFNVSDALMSIILIVIALDVFRRANSGVTLKHRILLSAVFSLGVVVIVLERVLLYRLQNVSYPSQPSSSKLTQPPQREPPTTEPASM